jgi:hypothetical protein
MQGIPMRAAAGGALAVSLLVAVDAGAQATTTHAADTLAASATAPRPAVRWTTEVRSGYHGQWRRGGTGLASDAHDGRARIRVGARTDLLERVEVGARLAGRFSTRQDDVRFHFDDHAPSPEGLRMGEITFDELFARLSLGAGSELRLGRFQTSFELAGVPRKSLDRNDSPNTDVSWTDGAHLSFRVAEGVRQHLIVQHNSPRGPTNALRHPLRFDDDGSRVTLYAGLQANPARGLVAQRELGVTVIPASVPRTGDAGPATYAAVVGRGALRFPAPVGGGAFVVGGEAGWAPTTPAVSRVGTVGDPAAESEGRALQLSANLMNAWRVHSLGVVHGRTGDGWLISPDIRPNNREWEVRYLWQYAPWGRLDARVRTQRDGLRRVGDDAPRRDRDVYLRTSIRF